METEPAENILYISFSVQNVFFVAKHHTGVSSIDILDNRSNFRVLFTKRLDEIVLRREYRRCCHQNDQNLAGCEAAANQYMTQQTVSGVLIKTRILNERSIPGSSR